MSAIISLLVDNGADIDAKSLNGSTPLHSAAVCLAKGSIDPLFDLECDYLLAIADNDGMSALHYSLKDVGVMGKEYFFDFYARKPNQVMNKLNVQYPWLNSLVELVKRSFISSVRDGGPNGFLSFLEMEDVRNETFHQKLEEK